MKGNIKEVAFVFLSGFLIGIGCTLVCIPPEREERGTLFHIDAPPDDELNTEVKEFIFELSEKYNLYRIKVTIEPEDKK